MSRNDENFAYKTKAPAVETGETGKDNNGCDKKSLQEGIRFAGSAGAGSQQKSRVDDAFECSKGAAG